MLTAQTLVDDTLEDFGIAKATDPGGGAGARFYPEPWQAEPYHDQSDILLLTGSAGGGKSRLAAEIVHAFMREDGPPATGLLLRKAREFASKSIVPFMRQTVIQKDAEYLKGDMTFHYPNGSLLYVGGMKDDMQREAVRSIGGDGGLDIVWFEEANAFTEQDFNEILGRMRGKARGRTQIILTTNPDAPNHWIHQRLMLGDEATVYYSSAKDNPHNPVEYRAKLEMMTGVQYERLVLGRWVQAEGAIFDNFSIEHNVTEAAEYNADIPYVIWGVDDGYAHGEGPGSAGYHPRVILLAQVTSQGGVQVFYEYYRTGELGEQSIEAALAFSQEQGWKPPHEVYIDSSAVELRQRFWGRDLYSIPATHPVSEGIKNVRRLIADGHDMRLLHIHPRCKNLIREMQSYRYDENSKVANVGEPKPLKVDDHGPDALRYLTWHLRYES